MLVKYGFSVNKRAKKEALWLCFGDNIYENLKRNIGNKSTVCPKCGKRFEKKHPTQVYCENCNRTYKKKEDKIITCIDCGKKLKVKGNSRACRCADCLKIYNRERERIKKQKQRARKMSPV